MAINQFVNVTVWKITRGVDDYGNNKQTLTDPIATGGYYGDNRNAINIETGERVYTDNMNIRMRYTPLVYRMMEHPSEYSLEFRGQQWRINDNIESRDRMSVEFICFRNDPKAAT